MVPSPYFSFPLVTKSLVDLFLILGIITSPIFVDLFPVVFTILSSVISDVFLVLLTIGSLAAGESFLVNFIPSFAQKEHIRNCRRQYTSMFEQSSSCAVSMLDRHDKFVVFFLRFSKKTLNVSSFIYLVLTNQFRRGSNF